jgi:hypothetical protein
MHNDTNEQCDVFLPLPVIITIVETWISIGKLLICWRWMMILGTMYFKVTYDFE